MRRLSNSNSKGDINSLSDYNPAYDGGSSEILRLPNYSYRNGAGMSKFSDRKPIKEIVEEGQEIQYSVDDDKIMQMIEQKLNQDHEDSFNEQLHNLKN